MESCCSFSHVLPRKPALKYPKDVLEWGTACVMHLALKDVLNSSSPEFEMWFFISILLPLILWKWLIREDCGAVRTEARWCERRRGGEGETYVSTVKRLRSNICCSLAHSQTRLAFIHSAKNRRRCSQFGFTLQMMWFSVQRQACGPLNKNPQQPNLYKPVIIAMFFCCCN